PGTIIRGPAYTLWTRRAVIRLWWIVGWGRSVPNLLFSSLAPVRCNAPIGEQTASPLGKGGAVLSTSAILISIAIVIVAVAIGWFLYQRQRRKALRARFGPEYSHAIREYGDESHAADALARRERRMEKIHIRTLSREDQRRFLDQWEDV